MSKPNGQDAKAAQKYNKTILFVVSCMALTTAGMVFSLRATIMEDLGTAFVGEDGMGPVLSAETVGGAVGASFLGFAAAVLVGSPLCDFVGMRVLLGLASLLHIGATLATVFAPSLVGALSAYQVLWGGMFMIGIAHGLVEAVINPLIATLYADDKTHRMNVLHAWWPGGLVIGGLLGYALHDVTDMGWQTRVGIVLVPAILYGVIVAGTKFPPTERIAAGVSHGDMLKEATRPLFLLLFLCMFLTAASELGPGQWVDGMLKNVGFPGILVLVYVSALMFVFRHFAGTFAHRLSPIGLMWFSSLFAGLGLIAISYAASPALAMVAATIWGAGVCFMWPTMLGIVSERFPKGGAWVLGLMGTAGNLAIYKVLPFMGGVYDKYTAQALPPGEDLSLLKVAAEQGNELAQGTLKAAQEQGAPYAFRYVAAGCAILIVAFGIIWLRDNAMGGYRAEKLDARDMNAADEDETDEAGASGA